MNKLITLVALSNLSLLSYSNAQTIQNGSFEENVQAGPAGNYQIETGQGYSTYISDFVGWRRSGDIFGYSGSGNPGDPGHMLIIGEGGPHPSGSGEILTRGIAETSISIATPGSYSITFRSFSPLNAKPGFGLVELFVEKSTIHSEFFGEHSDGAFTSQKIDFDLTEKQISDAAGQLIFRVSNSGKGLTSADLVVDNFAITQVPEPSSSILLALGLLSLITKRSRKV